VRRLAHGRCGQSIGSIGYGRIAERAIESYRGAEREVEKAEREEAE
jgi:hypothetical protein